MNCSLNWSFISCGELHCDSVKIKTMINSSLFFLRQCESLDWSDCLVVLLLSATHFRKSRHARLIRGCFSFSQCFRAGVFSSLSPPPSPPPPLPLTRPISSSLREVSTSRFREQIARSKKTPALQAILYLQLWLSRATPYSNFRRQFFNNLLHISCWSQICFKVFNVLTMLGKVSTQDLKLDVFSFWTARIFRTLFIE